MDKNTLLIFLAVVFCAVFLLTQSIALPAFGTGRQERNRLKQRLGILAEGCQTEQQIFLIRKKHLKKLSPLEKSIESLPGMLRLESIIERSGHEFPAYRLILLSLLLGLSGGYLAWMLSHQWLAVLFGTAILGGLPVMKLKSDLAKRFARFEEQLPEALDAMARALTAGYPFNETLLLVAKDMDDPIASEFRIVFDEMNYGVDMRLALNSLVDRVPSMSLMAIVTTIIVQRESGGNLAESFANITRLIRGRFRFQRRVLTLTAEARLSAWVLSLLPFIIVAVFSIIDPDYLVPLLYEPLGHKLILVGLVFLAIGILWIRKIISIEI